VVAPRQRRRTIWGAAGDDLTTRAADSAPMRAPSRALGIDDTCDTTTTLCVGKSPSPGASSTLPGSPARCRFDVRAQTITVVTRAWLKTSSWTTTWGWA
jgi:hypothetical protein